MEDVYVTGVLINAVGGYRIDMPNVFYEMSDLHRRKFRYVLGNGRAAVSSQPDQKEFMSLWARVMAKHNDTQLSVHHDAL